MFGSAFADAELYWTRTLAMNTRLKNEISRSLKEERLRLLSEVDLDLETPKYFDLRADSSDNESHEHMYDHADSIEHYRNFMNWLFETFCEDEITYRTRCLDLLENLAGKKVLVVGCGLGEDVNLLTDRVGSDGWIHAQDLSHSFLLEAVSQTTADNVIFSRSDALDLPYVDNYFDAVYHMGGIHLFGDIKLAIIELTRVCRVGGTVVFGDESVAEHLRDDFYGKALIHNNKLWGAHLPLRYIPLNALHLSISYVLGNCFYLIKYQKGISHPNCNFDVNQPGFRGGSVRSRYLGMMEGINPSIKDKFYKKLKEGRKPVSATLEQLINDYLNK